MSNTIVVTGATGTIGSRVVTELVARGRDVVALVRDAARAKDLAGARLAIGSFEDAASLRTAFTGADTVVLVTAANEHQGTQGEAAIEAARASGVRKIVRISALRAAIDGPTDNTRQHGRTEAQLRASGLAYVILRPQFFVQNLLGAIPSIVGEGKVYFGTGDGRIGMIDTRDVADAALVAATSDTYDGETLELTGPASIDYRAAAAAIGDQLGRPIEYVPLPPQAVGQSLREMGADAWTVGIITDYCAAYAKGFGDFTTEHVARMTGRPARSIDDFVREVLVPAIRAR